MIAGAWHVFLAHLGAGRADAVVAVVVAGALAWQIGAALVVAGRRR